MTTLLAKFLRTHKSAQKLINKLLHVVIITCILIALTSAYIASLIIVKPREIGFLDNLIEESLKKNYKNANVSIENAVISWDKDDFSFNINLYNVRLSIPNKLESYTPHIIIDISRRNLLLARFIIDKAILTGSEITLITKDEIIKDNPIKNFTLSPQKIPVFFNDLELYSSKINIAGNKLYIKNLIFEKENSIGSKYISTKSTIQHNLKDIDVEFRCSIAKSYLSECLGSINNIDNHIVAAFTNNTYFTNAKFSLNSTFSLNFNKQHNANFKIYSNNGTIHTDKHNPIIWDKFESDLSIDFDNNNITINDFYLSHLHNFLNLSGHYDIQNQTVDLTLNSNHISKDYTMAFWPKSFITPLNTWLHDRTNNLNITDAALNLEMNLLTKQINNFKLNFDFKQADVNFSKQLDPLTNSDGHFRLEDNIITITIDSGDLKNIKIDNATATIKDALIKKPHNLQIILNAKTDLANISEYLFKQDLAKFHFQGYATNYISLNIPIKQDLAFKDITFDAKVNADQLGFDYLVKNSKLQISLIKNNNSNNIIEGFADCLKCNADIPVIDYDADIIKSEDFTFTIDATPGQTKISNIKNNDLTNFKVNANLVFNEKNNLSSLTISDSYIGMSDINYTYERSSVIEKITILSKTSYISLDKLAKILLTKSNSKKKKYKINIDNVFLKTQLLGTNFDIMGYANKSDIIHYLKFTLSDANGSIVAKQKITSDNLSTTDIDIDNLGLLLQNADISSKILNGKVTINTTESKDGIAGRIFVNNVAVTTNKFFQKIYDITSFGTTPSEHTIFSRGDGNFTIKNNSLIIDHFSCYGSNIGITTSGNIDFQKNNYTLNGVIIPAATLNTLLGLRYIPIIGDLVTGGKDEGLISASYKADGNFGEDTKIKINPFSTLTPGFLRKIFKLKMPGSSTD